MMLMSAQKGSKHKRLIPSTYTSATKSPTAIGAWEVEEGTLTNCDESLGRRPRLGTLASPKLAELAFTMSRDSQGRPVQDFARLSDAYVSASKGIFVSCGQKIRQLNALARKKSIDLLRQSDEGSGCDADTPTGRQKVPRSAMDNKLPLATSNSASRARECKKSKV